MITVVIISCKNREGSAGPEQRGEMATSPENQAWQEVLANGKEALASLYLNSAYKIFPDATVIAGDSAIAAHYEKAKVPIREIYTDTVITEDANREFAYEIGGFLTDTGTPYKHLIIWNHKTDPPLREIEVIAETKYYSPAPEELDEARERWMELCNAHNAADLINTMYTEDALYYNHKPMISGREPLVKEYSYMNNPDYSLKLSPLYTAQVSNELVYEIGQCSGSYKGKYVIVWEKQDDGNWQVFFDSNI